jgi:NAD(P)H dehydrogenase (quinone)
MKVAVTAASGRLGTLIVTSLSEEIGPENTVAIARSPEKISVPNIEKRRGDYNSQAEMANALQGIDTVVIVSSPTGPHDRIALNRNVINGAQQAGVGKLVITSIVGNGGEENTLYHPTQVVNRQAEIDARNSGLEWVIGRNGLYLELDVDHIVRAGPDGVYENSGGDGRAPYITRDEIAFAFVKIATDDAHNGKIYNLISTSNTQSELVAMVNEVYGLNVRYQAISDDEYQGRVAAARGQIVADMLTGCYQCIRNGAFDVESDYAEAAGRPPRAVAAMVRDYYRAQTT